MAYLKDGDLDRGNKVIDDAAAAAGRDPQAIRRLLNISGTFASWHTGFLQGPPQHWIEELLPLAVEQGVSGLVGVARQ